MCDHRGDAAFDDLAYVGEELRGPGCLGAIVVLTLGLLAVATAAAWILGSAVGMLFSW